MWVLRRLLVAIEVLAILSVVSQVLTYAVSDFPLRDAIGPLFNVNAEQNLPALFSSMMFLVAALLAGAVAHARRRLDRPDRGYWVTSTVLFVVLAVDEFGSLHEKAAPGLRDLLDIGGGPQWSVWVLVAVPALALLLLFFLPFLRRLPRGIRRGFVLAALLFLGGAIVVELLGDWYAAGFGRSTLGFELIGTVEETLEMGGLAVLVYALLVYVPLGLSGTGWRLRVGGG
ncbi:MAG: hypothetical protein ACRDH1_03625 [Actinomycetota bacterium]